MKSKYLHFVIVLTLIQFVIALNSYSQWTTAGSVTGAGTFPSISVVDQNTVWIAGGPSGVPAVFRTTNGGTTWLAIPTTGVLLEVYNVWGVDDNTAYVGDGGAAGGAGGNARFYKTTNAGTTWTVVGSTGGTVGFINAVTFSKVNPLIAVAQSDPPLGGTNPYWISKSTDGGNVWNIESPPGISSGLASAQNSVVVIDNQFYGFGLNAAPARVYLTSNGGTNWYIGTLGLAGGFIGGHAFKEDKLLGLAATSTSLPSIARTTNGGLNWTVVATGTGVTGYCNLKWIEGTNTAYLSANVGAAGAVRKSTDAGLTWTTMTTSGLAGITHFEFRRVANRVYGYAITASGSVLKLSDIVTTTINATLNLTVNLQACSPMQDTITVLMRSATAPYLIVDSAKGYLSPTGSVSLPLTNVFAGARYYIVVKHRNSIETWSKSGGEVFTAGVLNFDFTTAVTQAFGSNMILVGSEASIYTGDVTQDGIVDGGDGALIDNDAFNFVSGYVPTDLNCDSIVDGSDASFADNNAFNFVAVIKP